MSEMLDVISTEFNTLIAIFRWNSLKIPKG